MKIQYINDRYAFVPFDEMEGGEPYDARDIVKRATAVRNGKDFVDFLLETPGSFFEWRGAPITGEHGFVPLDDFLTDYPRYVFPESYEVLADKHYPDIEVLDAVAIKAGAVGKYTEHHEGDEESLELGIDPTKGVTNPPSLRRIELSEFEELVQNIQLLERFAAIANGETSPFNLRRIDFGCKADVQFIDTQLWCKDYAIGSGQYTSFADLFTFDEWQEVRRALASRGYGRHCGSRPWQPEKEDELPPLLVAPQGSPDTTHPHTQICVYPLSWSDQQIARDIFLFFMRVLFEDEEELCLNHPFVVDFDEEGFHVRDNISSIAGCYREVAYMAESKSIRLCAHCGRPLIAENSRGNEAMYCSRSCNTMASSARRERVYALAASGVPVEEAIDRVGKRYERSIRRWYEESRRLLD